MQIISSYAKIQTEFLSGYVKFFNDFSFELPGLSV